MYSQWPGFGFESLSIAVVAAGVSESGIRTLWDRGQKRGIQTAREETGQTFQGVVLTWKAFILTLRDLASQVY